MASRSARWGSRRHDVEGETETAMHRLSISAALASAAAGLVLAVPATVTAGDGTQLSHGSVTRWAYVVRPTVARAGPSANTPMVSTVRTMTPEGGPNLVLALASRRDVYGRAWVRVRLAILPNNSTGWILRDALGELHLVRTRLVVERAQLRIVLWRNGRVLFRARAGVGQVRWPTPRGEFYVREKLAGFNDPFYGPIAFGTSARSAVLTDWPGGGYVGIHGTNQPGLLPGRVSHGCIRLRNLDIRRLAQLLPLGTPVSVR
jgi:L,D-transpeptidase catalytic domain